MGNNQKKPLPFWLKVMIKNQKLYIQFLRTDTHSRTSEVLRARKFLKWLQRNFAEKENI